MNMPFNNATLQLRWESGIGVLQIVQKLSEFLPTGDVWRTTYNRHSDSPNVLAMPKLIARLVRVKLCAK